MYFSLDRIVGQTAVLIGEDKLPLEVPLHRLPQEAVSGDVFSCEDGVFSAAPAETARRRQRVAGMLQQLLGGGREEE